MVDSPDVSSVFNEVAVQSELADERIDLPQAQRQLRIAFQVAAHEAVLARARFQRHGASVIGGSNAVLLGQRQHAQDAAHRNSSLALVHGLAQRADVGPALSARLSNCCVHKRSSPGDGLRLGSDGRRAAGASAPAAVGR